jgi:hypothetical protein
MFYDKNILDIIKYRLLYDNEITQELILYVEKYFNT